MGCSPWPIQGGLSIPPCKSGLSEDIWILSRGTVFVESTVAPYYGQPRGGTQYVLPPDRKLSDVARTTETVDMIGF
jgi:hypothetical protein